jgi:hypothetical protein
MSVGPQTEGGYWYRTKRCSGCGRLPIGHVTGGLNWLADVMLPAGAQLVIFYCLLLRMTFRYIMSSLLHMIRYHVSSLFVYVGWLIDLLKNFKQTYKSILFTLY